MEPSDNEKTQLLNEIPSANNVEDEAQKPPEKFKTAALTKPLNVELAELAHTLERLRIANANKPHLVGIFSNLKTLVEATAFLQEIPTWANNLYVSFISELLDSVIYRNVKELRKLKNDQHCTLYFEPTAAAITSLILSKHMERLRKGDSYYTISDLNSWREAQLHKFQDQTEKKVKEGIEVKRIFNLMLGDPKVNPLRPEEKKKIVEQHLDDSETWNKQYVGKYHVKIFTEEDYYPISNDQTLVLRRGQRISGAHFGVFSHGKKGRTVVEYEVEEYDLSEMNLWTDKDVINKHLEVFNGIWEATPPRAKEDIREISQLNITADQKK